MRMPSSWAVRKTRMAISLRLATSSLRIFGMTGQRMAFESRRLSVSASRRIVKCTAASRIALVSDLATAAAAPAAAGPGPATAAAAGAAAAVARSDTGRCVKHSALHDSSAGGYAQAS